MDRLRTFCSGCSSLERVGRDSIYGFEVKKLGVRLAFLAADSEHVRQSYHFDRSICEVDEFGKDFSAFAGSVQLGGVP